MAGIGRLRQKTVTIQTPILLLPGFRGSGAAHWQTLWAQSDPAMRIVRQRNWDEPDLNDWLETLHDYISACDIAPVVIAHSLACSLVAHWVRSQDRGIAAALLVAPSDVDSPAHTPQAVRGFAPMPLGRFPFRSIV